MNLKKPKFWDYKKPNIFAYILLPLAFLLRAISKINSKPKKKIENIRTICVGNIYIGGTGKTSLCIKIHDLLKKKNIKTCFVKKFYKNQIDEQKILNNAGELFLSKKRIDAIEKAKKKNYQVAILDDGLQDNSIFFDTRIVCFNNINWIGNGMNIPAGPLREHITRLKDYQNIFLNGNLENLQKIKEKILKINKNINIFIGKYIPVNLMDFNKDHSYLVFSGIGNHKTFISMLKKNGFKIVKEMEYADHYNYTKNDIEKILNNAQGLNCEIITTEKDYLRLNNIIPEKIKYIKSELQIVNEDEFIRKVIQL